MKKLQGIDFNFEIGSNQSSQMKGGHDDAIADIYEVDEEKLKAKRALQQRSYGSSDEDESEEEEEAEIEVADSDDEAEVVEEAEEERTASAAMEDESIVG